MACNCITEFNAQLEEHELDTSIVFDRQNNTLVAQTNTRLNRKDNGREERRSGKPRLASHKFCPFCGTSYAPAPAEEGGAA